MSQHLEYNINKDEHDKQHKRICRDKLIEKKELKIIVHIEIEAGYRSVILC